MKRYGMYPVTTEDTPEHDPLTQKIVTADTPVLKDTEWVLTKTVEDMSAEEVAALNDEAAQLNRTKRNSLISETDYFALTDVTMDAPMTTYRQQLRDITTHANWPHLSDEDWPVKP